MAVLVPGRPQGEFLMFCRERDPERELWDGPRAGPDGAVAAYGADDAFPITDLDDILPGCSSAATASTTRSAPTSSISGCSPSSRR